MMFPAQVYIERRKKLISQIPDGLLFFPGNREVPANYAANPFPFRQDSTFLYYFGLDHPGLNAVLDAQSGEEILYGDDITLEEIIWMGFQDGLADLAGRTGIQRVKPLGRLQEDLSVAISKQRRIHYLPPYSDYRTLHVAALCQVNYPEVTAGASVSLIKAVVAQRSIKDAHELAEMEQTMTNVTRNAYLNAVESIRPGNYEYQVSGNIEGTALQHGCSMAYPVICSVRGDILHNHHHHQELKDGQLLLIDAGAESPMHYATDITRTFPVSGTFTAVQQDIYNLVLDAQLSSIGSVKPGVPFRDVHMVAAKRLASGLKDLGLMKGNIEDAVQLGAHALFFPHGIGHMIGLDVHDMEDLGEEYVGYDEEFKRSEQFGTAYLRMARRLKPGHVVTVEPGIYFIGALIDQWKSVGRHADYLDYPAIDKFRYFGGIRIEDNVVVTDNGCRVIGEPIPK